MLIQSTAWFDPNTAGVIGGVMGGVFGAGFGGIGGPLAGTLVPKGKAKVLVVGVFVLATVIGVLLLITGLVALLMGQPIHVWGIFVLTGVILAVVMGALIPVILKGYAMAEQRKLDAEELRRA